MPDKVSILACLISQLLTYADVRDVIDDRFERIKQLKMELRTRQAVEKKRDQEQVTTRLKLKAELKSDKTKLKEALEKLNKEHEKKQVENSRKMGKVFKDLYSLQSLMG